MCGIVGFLGANNYQNLNKSLNAIQHRGPDFQDIYYEEKSNLGFGHSRLSIIDTSPRGNQPMFYENRYVIIYNGEIYNFVELKEDLLQKGLVFKSNSDTEVLIAMYAHYGKQMLPMLNGIFAFAIWDMQNKKLFLARDYIGTKPLYYYSNSSLFAFASEIKALLFLTPAPASVNLNSINNENDITEKRQKSRPIYR